jgi:hypothetical protein
MADVFISYKREDRARVEALTELLIDLELSVWFDAGIEVGAAWEARIMEEAEAASAMIVCWSFAATASPWVKREADVGLKRGVLVPVMLQWCAPVAPFDAIQAGRHRRAKPFASRTAPGRACGRQEQWFAGARLFSEACVPSRRP